MNINTQDLSYAAYLLLCGLKLTGADMAADRSGWCEFHFEAESEGAAYRAFIGWNRGSCLVPARAYRDALNKVKSLTYQTQARIR